MKRPFTWVKDPVTGSHTAVRHPDAEKIRGDFKIISSAGSIFGNMTSLGVKELDSAIKRMLERSVKPRKS